MRLIQRVLFLTLFFFAIAVSNSWASSNDTVTVMTKNMDSGTDFGFFFANLQTNPALGAQLTFEEFQKNNFPLRAELLAQEIAATRPLVVGLQEVTLLRAGTDPADPFNTPVVLVDQLDLLLTALGGSYHLVDTSTLTDLAFPLSQTMTARFTDRDAIIARDDLPESEFSITNVQSHLYGTLLSLPPGPNFPGFTAPRGWISADVTAGTNTFRFVTTHLESSGGLYGNPDVDLIQAAQANELAAIFVSSPFPVVISADFNSNATHTPPEQTLSYGIMLKEGFTDSWRAVHRGEPGFTWPLYVEDPLQDHPQGPFERIDFVFVGGLVVTSAERTGVKKPHSSDHAGVVATLAF